jgi:tRNA threonylcarbamoyl adenosine modification protein (Sua5/YciO/YrdC/YwlC family)
MDPDYPEVWRLSSIARLLRDGAVGVVPTDTVYTFVCSIDSRTAIERLYRLKQMDARKPLSILCRDMSMMSRYTRSLSSSAFRALRRCLPGPYTFIFKASSEVPRIMLRKRRTIGVRIPDDEICTALLQELELPLLCSSVRTPDDSFWNNPAEISEKHKGRLDFVVDGGERLADPSTVIDYTERSPEIIRAGKGDISLFE